MRNGIVASQAHEPLSEVEVPVERHLLGVTVLAEHLPQRPRPGLRYLLRGQRNVLVSVRKRNWAVRALLRFDWQDQCEAHPPSVHCAALPQVGPSARVNVREL